MYGLICSAEPEDALERASKVETMGRLCRMKSSNTQKGRLWKQLKETSPIPNSTNATLGSSAVRLSIGMARYH